jgi:hypothetical protein
MVLYAGKIIKLGLPILAMGAITISCVDEYWPDLGTKYDKVLVVDGMVTDQPGPYTIRLSQSATVNEPVFMPLSGYQATIVDNLGNSELLTEEETGVYRTSPEGIRGVVGRSYQLVVVSPDGKRYESGFEELRLATGIDSIYTVTEHQPVTGYDTDLPGYQFYVDTYRSEMDTNYFFWRLEGTYKYHANHTLKYYFDGQFHSVGKWDSLYTCYATNKVHDIFTYKTEDLTEPKVLGLPLHFVGTETKKLSIRYSLLVRQMSITRQAYEFWNSIAELEAEQESLYTRQPYQIRGNMNNVADAEEPVLGYFMAAGVVEKRIFVKRPTGVNFYYNSECNLYTEDLSNMLWLMYAQWPVLLTTIPVGPGVAIALPAKQWCIDCRKEAEGGQVEPPEFWIDY